MHRDINQSRRPARPKAAHLRKKCVKIKVLRKSANCTASTAKAPNNFFVQRSRWNLNQSKPTRITAVVMITEDGIALLS